MRADQIKLIRETWRLVGEEPLAAGILFFDNLYQLEPGLRSIFRTPVSEQTMRLMQMTGTAINLADRPEILEKEIQILAGNLAELELGPSQYAAIGKALIKTLETTLGKRWTDEVIQAWMELHDFILRTAILSEQPA
ncbi:hypothetical protein KJS94_00745 [Flavihumibacter rivuli]|uniref:globin domain-containing protein n=1 Tax=Flavihumibacter rivuli TaxID=2838156 RepID=UPI001BDDFBFC|nr:globin domain-containing protein [Flavihumibacter rivuli]ULQ56721.1 hypothetical protein KJS94_00745 [Flavihumibacter rivuli]